MNHEHHYRFFTLLNDEETKEIYSLVLFRIIMIRIVNFITNYTDKDETSDINMFFN